MSDRDIDDDGGDVDDVGGHREMPSGAPDFHLNGRQWTFANEYLKDFNATRAARDAGYSANFPGGAGFNLLRRANVRRAIEWVLAQRARQYTTEHARIIQELLSIAFFDPGEVAVWGEDHCTVRSSEALPPHVRHAIKSITSRVGKHGSSVTLAFCDKLEALSLVMRATGMLRENVTEDARGAFQKWRDNMLQKNNSSSVTLALPPTVEAPDDDGPDGEAGSQEPPGESGK